MKISNSSHLALLAVGYIAIHSKDGIIMSDIIAQAYNMELENLLKILQRLVKVGILNSKRGPNGGFTMGKPLDQITLLEIFESMDGPAPSQHYFVEQGKNERFAVNMGKLCSKAIAEKNNVLRNVTLAELVGTRKK